MEGRRSERALGSDVIGRGILCAIWRGESNDVDISEDEFHLCRLLLLHLFLFLFLLLLLCVTNCVSLLLGDDLQHHLPKSGFVSRVWREYTAQPQPSACTAASEEILDASHMQSRDPGLATAEEAETMGYVYNNMALKAVTEEVLGAFWKSAYSRVCNQLRDLKCA